MASLSGGVRETAERKATFIGQVKTDKKVVIGIDFGTAYSGISFVFAADPETVHFGAPGGRQRSMDAGKVPTVLFEGPEGWLFGDEAIEKYTRVIEDHDEDDGLTSAEYLRRRGVNLFRRFKMVLKGRTSGDYEELQAPSMTGENHSLMDLITKSLEFLSKFALNEMKMGWAGALDVSEEDILWVLTVPAIWNDYGKAFMRRAAFGAGMIPDEASDQLLLALEPESASLAVHNEASRLGLFNEGASFMILDCGGGTIDVTMHKVATSDPLVLDELSPPRGGPWGGESVDEEFRSFLEQLFGEAVFKELDQKCPGEVVEVVNEFHTKKEMFDPEVDEWTPVSLSEIFGTDVAENLGIADLATLVEDFNRKTEIKFDYSSERAAERKLRRGVLTFSRQQMLTYFLEPSLEKICELVRSILSTLSVDAIVIVGGYGASRALASRVRSEFHHMNLIVPDKPQAAVVQGAAYFGLYTDVVGSRITKYAYGVKVYEAWKPESGIPQSDANYIQSRGKYMVKDVFSLIVESGTSVPPTQQFMRKNYYPLSASQRNITFEVYRSEEGGATPKRVTDPGCHWLGKIVVPCRGGSDLFDVEFTFGTELRVQVIRNDGETHFVAVDME